MLSTTSATTVEPMGFAISTTPRRIMTRISHHTDFYKCFHASLSTAKQMPWGDKRFGFPR